MRQLRYERLSVFMSELVDLDGRRLQVAAHHELWCELVSHHPRLVLLAPRDHSKTTLALVYVLWQFYRHAIDRAGAIRSMPQPGPYLAVLFSATGKQAAVLMSRFRDLLAANAELFVTKTGPASSWSRPLSASETHIRLASGAELLTRAYGTSTRGLHPDLLLLDDVLSDDNSGTELARTKAWTYFTSTLLPMHPARILVVGTTIHAADLLQRLSPRVGLPYGSPVLGFAWRRFPALDERTETALWPGRHPYAELVALRDAEPVMFAREYMNDPRDERTTYFPRSLTGVAVTAGAGLTLVPYYRKTATEIVVLGADLARSERIGADYTVAIVVAFDWQSGIRRVLTVRRQRGLDFAAQVALFTDLVASYGIDLALIENNGFQGWLLDELRTRPGGQVFLGHTTGRGKLRLDRDGIPRLKLALVAGRWVVPSGDEESRAVGRIWQAELAAFGWRDQRVVAAGEHDDVVIASWYVELAVTLILRWLAEPRDQIVTMEDLGIKPVKIGEDY